MAKCGFLQDFKAFAMRGNVVDMAVGVIIGGAFGKIVASVVNDVLMPPIGWLIGGVKFDELKYELPVNPLNPDLEPVTINYGAFCQACSCAASPASRPRRKRSPLHPLPPPNLRLKKSF